MSEEKFDFLVILNGIATNDGNDPNSELIELNWCSYDLSKKSVNAESSYLIRPINTKDINHNFLRTNLINFSDLEKADDLLEVVKKFNIFIFETYTKNNFSFAIITKDDWLLGTQIKRESSYKRIKLGYHLDKFFNLINEFQRFYKIENSQKFFAEEKTELKDLLKFLNLKQTEANRPSMMELNTLVRIVNRMIKDGHHFNFEVEVKKIYNTNEKEEFNKNWENSQTKKLSEGNDIEIGSKNSKKILDTTNLNSNLMTNKKNNLNQNLVNISWNEPAEFFIRIKNLPFYYGKKEIQDLFYLYDFSDMNDSNGSENIILSYDIFGRKTGEAVIRVINCNESALNEILSSYKFRQISNNNGHISLLDIFKSNAKDYLNCLKNTKFLTENIYEINYVNEIKQNSTDKKSKNLFVKIKNLSTSSKEESIQKFFKDFYLAENGIKLLKNKKGNLLGEAMIAFTTEEDANRAIKEINGKNFMNHHINLELSNLNEFENFASSNSFYLTIKNLHDYVGTEIVQRCLFVNNFPLDINRDFLIKTFEIINLNESNFIIDENSLRNYGCVIVIFQSEDDAGIAKNYLKNITIRWEERTKKLEVENLLFLVNKGNEL